jgi:single-stranded-DNA-specific exonuclease
MNRLWIQKSQVPNEKIEELSRALNLNSFLTAILIQRGISTFDEAKSFFRPSLDQLHDPFLLKGMEVAIKRIKVAVERAEKILVFGDYDVDGTTAVALVVGFFKTFYKNIDSYIPDRYSEGYGVSVEGIEFAEKNDFKLVITLDLGIKATSMVSLASEKGIDFIICDHHLPGTTIPLAVSVLDPKQPDCNYPYDELSGCGLGFKLIQAYSKRYFPAANIYQYLDLVCVSIASDIVPITGENRILAFHGLKKLNGNPCPGLKALKEVSGIRNELDIAGIVFTLGPRINSAGRVAHANAAVSLLTASTKAEALELANKLNLKNDLRRSFDSATTEEALALIESDSNQKSKKTTVLFKETWHKGVIGIVAARCIEKYYRPTVILTESDGKITGSARSIEGFDLYTALLKCSDLFEKFGGHKYAAGLTMDKSKLPEFEVRFEEIAAQIISDEMLIPKIEIDQQLNFDAITPKFISVLKQMAPFGPQNLAPVFESRNVVIVNSLSSLKDRHVRFVAGQQNNSSFFNSIGFDLIHHYERLKSAAPFRIVYSIEENVYNGNITIQLRIKDIKFDLSI